MQAYSKDSIRRRKSRHLIWVSTAYLSHKKRLIFADLTAGGHVRSKIMMFKVELVGHRTFVELLIEYA